MRIIKRILLLCAILLVARIVEVIALPILMDDEPRPTAEPEPTTTQLHMPTFNGPLRDPFRPDHPTRAEWEAEKKMRLQGDE